MRAAEVFQLNLSSFIMGEISDLRSLEISLPVYSSNFGLSDFGLSQALVEQG